MSDAPPLVRPQIAFKRVPTPDNPVIGNAIQKDPRGFGRGFSPKFQPDEETLDFLRRRTDAGIVPWDDLFDRLYARNLPPQLVQGTYPMFLTAAGLPALVIPKNSKRTSWLISNFTMVDDVTFSYDRPVQMGTVAGVAIFGGVSISAPNGNSFSEANGSISINDIWVVCTDPDATYPIPIIGYEGTLSISGNKP